MDDGLIINIGWEWALGIIGTLLVCAWKFSSRFTCIEKDVDKLGTDFGKFSDSLDTWFKDMNNWARGLDLTISKIQVMEGKSPLVLKKDYRHFVEKSDIVNQVKKENDKLVEWLASKQLETGLDAQKEINALVTSIDIEKFIDLKNYKQYVYKHGKDSGSAMAILAVYLYEILIPQVIKEE